MLERFPRILSLILAAMGALGLCLAGGAISSWAGTGAGAKASTGAIYDQAKLLDPDEKARLEKEAAVLKEEMGMDVVVVTTDDAQGKSSRQYADDFYTKGGFGTGKDYSGILFLIDMDNRELYIDVVGKMNRYITDKRWKAMLGNLSVYAKKQDFSACIGQFFQETKTYYKKGIPSGQYNYDEATGKASPYRSIRWYEALLAAGVAFFAAITSCLAVKNQYQMKQQRRLAGNYHLAYRADCSFTFQNQDDQLVHTRVTQVIIPRNHGPGGRGGGGGSFSGQSTTHTSSGRTFGGGGQKF